ncbi:MAG: hypothetical protein L0211_02505 [Planctomycetaceae bacterium]|nr:hypothetical protein [Planctomycetaceae bacterium]
MQRRKVLAVFDGSVGGLPRLRWRSEILYEKVDASGEPVPLGVEHHAACPECEANLTLSQCGNDGCQLSCGACGYQSLHPEASFSRFGRRLLDAPWRDA